MKLFGRILAMALKEVMHIQRDPQLLIYALVFPIAMILLFGYGVTFDIDKIPLVVVNQDRSVEAQKLVGSFTSSDAFLDIADRQRASTIEPLFRRGVAKAALVIPKDFERDIKRGGMASAQLLVDGSDDHVAAVGLGYANAIALASSERRLTALVGDVAPPVSARVRTLFNPELSSTVFLVPGLMVVILVMIAVMLTALTVAREYERGSMEQLFATPVGKIDIILGKLGPYFVLGLVQVLIVLVLGIGLFGVPMRGSVFLLFCIASLFLLAMLMQGLLISVMTRNQVLASQLAAISTLLPSMLLSGFIFPISGMPLILRGLAHVLPATYLVDALRGVMLRGNGIGVVWPDALALAAYFSVMLFVAVGRFKRRVG